MFEFENSEVLYLLIFVLALPLLQWLYIQFFKKRLSNFINVENFKKRTRSKPKMAWLKTVIYSIVAALIILSLAGPRIGDSPSNIESSGYEIIICLDVSQSMLVADENPNRLGKAKKIIQEVIKNAGSDKIGLSYFTSLYYPQIPLTNDREIILEYLENVEPKNFEYTGSNIGLAIERSALMLQTKSKTSKIILLLSDGEDFANEIIPKNNDKYKQMYLYSVALGTKFGGKVPAINNDGFLPKARSKANPELLSKISKKWGGKLIEDKNPEDVAIEFWNKVAKHKKSTFKAGVVVNYKYYYHWFLIPALILLIIELFIFDVKRHEP